MEEGTCQDGLMVIDTARVDRMGVVLLGAPTTTFDTSAAWPDSISASEASGTLTRIYWPPGLCGIQRNRSILTAICPARAAAEIFSRATVRSFRCPVTVVALSAWKARKAAGMAASE